MKSSFRKATSAAICVLLITSNATYSENNGTSTKNHSTPTIKIIPIKITPTSNSSADSILQKFAAANKDNPAAIAAPNNVAADIKSDPAKYTSQDGRLDIDKIKNAVLKAFSNTGTVAVQAPDEQLKEAAGSVSSAGLR